MAHRVGLIQTGGIGDIIMALPIADYYLERGSEVVWPIYEDYLASFAAAKPAVRFIAIPRVFGAQYELPRQLVDREGCDPVFSLYNHTDVPYGFDEKLAWYVSLDEYKYAVARVPLARKWELRIVRNLQRELALWERLNITGPYICLHSSGSNINMGLSLPEAWQQSHQIVPITSMTDNLFDWIHTLEHADKLILLDSCFANLVEQLNLPNEKYLILRSAAKFTPVFKNGWRFLVPQPNEKGDVQLRLV